MNPSESTTLTVSRSTSYTDRIRRYGVYLDDHQVASLGALESISFSALPGKHSLVIKIDWCRSNVVEFDCRSGGALSFECGSSMTGMRALLALLYVTIWRHQYLWLRGADTVLHSEISMN